MGNQYSRPAPTSNTASAPPLHPRSLKRRKSAPHSLRLLHPLESPSISTRCPSLSINSFSEKWNEKEKETHHPNRKGQPCVCVSSPPPPPPPPPPPLPRTKPIQPLFVPVLTHVLLPSPTAGLLTAPSLTRLNSESDFTYVRFLHDYPQYASSWHIDALHCSEYSAGQPKSTKFLDPVLLIFMTN
jgi:hypothetical protein